MTKFLQFFKKTPLLIKLFILALLTFIFIYVVLFFYVWIAAYTLPTTKNAQAIIVLGCQVKPDGTLSIQLKNRIDLAYEKYLENPMPVVLTGGQGKDEPAPEGVVMAQALSDMGVPPEHLIIEQTSTSTVENLVNARTLLDDSIKQVMIITSEYHVPRALAIAKDLQIDACGAGAKLNPIFFLKNYGREALAWGKYLLNKYIPLLQSMPFIGKILS